MAIRKNEIKDDVIMCETLLRMFHRGDFRNDHPLQRAPEAWTNEYRDDFIATVIKDENVDSIKMCEEVTDSGITIWLIDGGNRVRALDAFKNGEFKLGRLIDLPIATFQVPRKDAQGHFVEDENGNRVYDEIEYDLRNKWYKDLPQELKDVFNSWGVKITKRLNSTPELIEHDIRRYNHQGKMNHAETAVTYMGKDVARQIKEIADESRFFKDCGTYSESDKKRSKLERMIAESMMATFYLDNWKKDAKKMGAFLYENATKEEFEKMKSNLHRLEHITDRKTDSLFNMKNSSIWFAVFNKFTELDLDDKKFYEFLCTFVDELHSKKVNDVSWDELEELRGTKDTKVITCKIQHIEKLMMDYLQVEEEETVSPIEFVKENVDPEVTEEDIELYESAFEDYTVEVDNKSKLLDQKNRLSWIGLVTYAFQNDKDMELNLWMPQYFKEHSTYLRNQKENYIQMKDSFDLFCKKENGSKNVA